MVVLPYLLLPRQLPSNRSAVRVEYPAWTALSGASFRWLCRVTKLRRQGVREAAATPAGNLDISLNVSAAETVLFNNAWDY